MDLSILRLKERLEIALELGESHYREFKSSLHGTPQNKENRPIKDVCDDISRTLVAFANADGGELLVGVEDSGIVTGLNYSSDKIETLINAPRNNVHKDTPLPTFKATLTELEGKKILYFSIPKGNEYVYLTSDGRCIQRKDLESVPISAEEILFTREEAASREYDRQFIDRAGMGDIDIDLIQQITAQLSIKVTPEKFLQHIDIAEFNGTELKLKRAALLLFAKNPSKWHPRLQVRVIKVADTVLKSGEEFNVVFDEEITDNIVKLIESSWEIIRPHLTETRFLKQALFKTQIIYPELACREALINAIAHRDYSIEGRGIEVYVFNDRLEIQSPGELLSAVKISDLESLDGSHQSRNSNIAKALREIGYMRELGEGIRRIFDLMKTNDLQAPKLESKNKSFKVLLSQKHIFTKEEKLWLDNFEQINLTREQKTVVRLGTNGKLFSVDEIWEAVGIVDTDKYRQLIESLMQVGILKRTIKREQAKNMAWKSHTSQKQLKQFQIVIPTSFKPSFNSSPPPAKNKSEHLKNKSMKSTSELVDNSDYAKIFVSNISFETNEKELSDLFMKFGDVVSVKIPRHFKSKYIRGFAYVEFDKLENAEAAINKSSEIELRDRKLYVQWCKPK
ncbi:MAG: hypothetical protein EOO90_21495 [Pedobacter sp.]|nr:MAG: hypothetical protein EOO90_21495 [Pedobacter sp.]